MDHTPTEEEYLARRAYWYEQFSKLAVAAREVASQNGMSVEGNINAVPSISLNKRTNPGYGVDVRSGVGIQLTDWRVGPMGPEASCEINAGGIVRLKEEPGWVYFKARLHGGKPDFPSC